MQVCLLKKFLIQNVIEKIVKLIRNFGMKNSYAKKSSLRVFNAPLLLLWECNNFVETLIKALFLKIGQNSIFKKEQPFANHSFVNHSLSLASWTWFSMFYWKICFQLLYCKSGSIQITPALFGYIISC